MRDSQGNEQGIGTSRRATTARPKGGGRYDYIGWLVPITRQSVGLLVGSESGGEQPLSEFYQLYW